MTDESSSEPTDSVERIVFLCLERWETEGEEAIVRACREHPELAASLRARFEGLRQAGLLPGQEEDAPFPETLGDFRLLRRLGGGGMGVVYLAEQRSLGREVALKLIRPEHHYFPSSRARFRREVEAVARLNHPGIVPIFTVGEEHKIPYFAMERVTGCTLAEALEELRDRRPQDLAGADLGRAIAKHVGTTVPEACRAFDGSWAAAAVRLVAEVADALQHAHERGVVHRDVKPSNVMVTAGGRVMLVDFGLARAEGSARLTATSSTIGSLAYMPPEQAGGQSRDPAPTTDVYSLGVTLYEVLTLRPAFLGTSTEETRRQVLEASPRSIRAINPSVPRDAETVCQKAMERDPQRRYATAAELARDLRNVLELRPIEARRPRPWLRTARLIQRRPALSVAMLMAFVLVVIVPTLFALYEKGKREEAERERYASTILAASASLHMNEVRECKRLLAACSEPHRGWEWRHLDAACDRSVAVHRVQSESILALAVSPDSQSVVTAGFGGLVLLRDARSGRTLRELAMPAAALDPSVAVGALAFDPGGTRVVAGLNQGTVLEWDAATGVLAPRERTHHTVQPNGKTCGVTGIVFQPDGKRFFTSSRNHELRIWETESDRSRVFGPGGEAVNSLALGPEGALLASGTDRGTIRIHDAKTRALLRTIEDHERPVRSLAFSRDGELLASAADDGTVRVFSVSDGERKLVLSGHQGTVYSVVLCADGKRLVSAGQDRTVRVWSLASSEPLAVLRGHDAAVLALVFRPGSEDLFSCSADGTVRTWDLTRVDVLLPADKGWGWITSLALPPDGKVLATGQIGLKVCLRDPDTGLARVELPFANRAVYAVAFARDGKRIAAGGFKEGEVMIWDVASGQRVPEFAPTADTVNSVAFSADGSEVFGGCEDGVVRVWRAADGKLLRSLERHAAAVTCLAVSPDGARVVTGSRDRTLRVCVADTGQVIATLAGHTGHVHAVAFAPDGRRIASGAADRTVRIWDAESGRCLGELRGHDNLVSSVAWSPDGRRLVSGSWDQTLRVWDPAGMRLLCILRGHADQVTSLVFTPDGTRVISGSWDGSLRVWGTRTSGPVAGSRPSGQK